MNEAHIDLVQGMQDFILAHAADEPFPYDALYRTTGYSRRHADRIFRAFMHKTPREYVLSVRLTESAQQLLSPEKTILDVALAHYETHEGYTKAFEGEFGIPPSRYRRGKSFISLFVPYSIRGYYDYLARKEKTDMEAKDNICMIVPVDRPERKLIFMRSEKATDYFSFCEEKGCDWEGLFNSMPARMDTAAILTLPKRLQKPGFGNIAAGIEVPLDYDGEIPEDCELAQLAPCRLLYFTSRPYTADEEFFDRMQTVFDAAASFAPGEWGYEPADDICPTMNLGGQPERGARLVIPVREKK